MTLTTEDILKRVADLPDEKRQALIHDAIAATQRLRWLPNPGPQTTAYFCPADLVYIGGQGGGGKSDLLIGLALTALSTIRFRAHSSNRSPSRSTCQLSKLTSLPARSRTRGRDPAFAVDAAARPEPGEDG